jgi:hypothetical protein
MLHLLRCCHRLLLRCEPQTGGSQSTWLPPKIAGSRCSRMAGRAAAPHDGISEAAPGMEVGQALCHMCKQRTNWQDRNSYSNGYILVTQSNSWNHNVQLSYGVQRHGTPQLDTRVEHHCHVTHAYVRHAMHKHPTFETGCSFGYWPPTIIVSIQQQERATSCREKGPPMSRGKPRRPHAQGNTVLHGMQNPQLYGAWLKLGSSKREDPTTHQASHACAAG